MLNPTLKLNEKIFDTAIEQKATRDGFGEALVELGEKNPNVVVLTADLSESTRTDGFEKKFPERFFEVGVAEQNMAAIAAGLATAGKTAFISSYATFSPGKNWETIRTTIVYNNADVKIAGHHSGIMTGPDGATHQATEDIAITRAWPGITVFVPCDSIEAKKATLESANIKGPVYLRFTRDKTPIITTLDTPFEKNKIQVFWTSDNPKVTIFACGYMLYFALLAAKNLEKDGIEVLVANVSSIKPSDEQTIVELSKKTGKVITVEDHQTTGGLGGMIAEVLAKKAPIQMDFVGLDNTFAESGNWRDLLKKYNMDEVAIVEKVKKIING
ncbi:MAG TPA: transketolase C-terminal domain-containing protein [Candidatus Sulfotelmatobacter sp.]|nr:transketolase C-terminal domain-containing protein [Candidatus Sulfotelmatobacter sp.]